MTNFTSSWDTTYESEPSVVSQISQTGAQTFQNMKKSIRERMELEHYWGKDDGSDGVHKFAVGTTAARPTVGFPGQLFVNSEAAAIQIWTNDVWSQPLLNAGVVMMFMGTSVPDGWTYLSGYEDMTFCTVPGNAPLASEGGQTGGTWNVTGMNAAGGWSMNQAFNTSQAQSVGGGADGGFLSGGQHFHTVTVSKTVADHTHTFDTTWRPPHVNVFLATKA